MRITLLLLIIIFIAYFPGLAHTQLESNYPSSWNSKQAYDKHDKKQDDEDDDRDYRNNEWKHNNGKSSCPDEIISQTDSVYFYSWDPVNMKWTNSTIDLYLHDGVKNQAIIQVDYFTREPMTQALFSDWINDLPITKIDQNWVTGIWEDKYRSSYNYTTDGLLTELIIEHLISGSWTLKTRRSYHYNDKDQLELIDLQIWTNGAWIDYSYQDFIYSSDNILVEMKEFYIDSIHPWRRYKYFYNPNGLLTERLIQILSSGEWENQKKYTYSYNEYGFLEKFLILSWDEFKFQNEQLRQYYRTEIIPDKVLICHKGKPICVSANALKAHLAHGDRIGICLYNKDQHDRYKNKEARGKSRKQNHKSELVKTAFLEESVGSEQIQIYPNPANDHINIQLNNQLPSSYTHGYIFDIQGRIRKSYKNDGQQVLHIDCSDLDNGLYFVHIRGESSYVEKIIIQR